MGTNKKAEIIYAALSGSERRAIANLEGAAPVEALIGKVWGHIARDSVEAVAFALRFRCNRGAS